MGVLCVALLVVLVLQARKPAAPAETNVTLLLKQDLSKLSDDITKLKDGLQNQISERLDKTRR